MTLCPCLHCQWQRTDRSEDFYRWASTREYRPPIGATRRRDVTISDLILQLQQILFEHGDVEVVTGDWRAPFVNFSPKLGHLEIT